jgi:hypothetical protein
LDVPFYIANADYEDKDSNPLFLAPGDEITTGPADKTWSGWVWAENNSGCDGYVPEEVLELIEGKRFRALSAFNPTVLVIKRGDQLISLKQIHHWHWCRNTDGAEGWVADYLLKESSH